MATAGKGLPFIGKMGLFIDRVLHPTVQKVGHSAAAIDVKTRAYYCVNGISTPLTAEAGSDNNTLKKTGLNAVAGDIIRILTTANGIKESEIVVDEATDADTAVLAGYLSAAIATGDTFHLLRAVSEIVSSDGITLATVISPPIQYNVKAAGSTSAVTVIDDQDTVANTRALPVSIRSLDGAAITINAGDLNVAVSHVNDSIKIGDGTTLAGITVSNEIKTHDADAKTALDLLHTDNGAVKTVQVTPVGAGASGILGFLSAIWDKLNGSLAVTGTFWQATQPVSGTVDVGNFPATQAVTGTFWQATQPVSGAFYQATQPVSIASMPSTPVTGTFWQATQPVSIASMPSTPVTGTFWQATQPISIAAAVKHFGTARTTTFAEYLSLTTVQTFTAPANAFGALIQASDANAANIRFRTGTATTTSGMQLQPGRSENLHGGTDITVCSESGTNAVSILWFVEAQS